MEIRKLLDLGFELEFVSVEEGGGTPFFYLIKNCTEDYMSSVLSDDVELSLEDNDISKAEEFVEKYGDKELKVFTMGGLEVKEDKIRVMARLINSFNGIT